MSVQFVTIKLNIVLHRPGNYIMHICVITSQSAEYDIVRLLPRWRPDGRETETELGPAWCDCPQLPVPSGHRLLRCLVTSKQASLTSKSQPEVAHLLRGD